MFYYCMNMTHLEERKEEAVKTKPEFEHSNPGYRFRTPFRRFRGIWAHSSGWIQALAI